MPPDMADEPLDNGCISIEQQVELGGQVLQLTGKVNLLGLSAAQREVLLDLMDTFARLGSKTPGRRRRRQPQPVVEEAYAAE